MCAATTTSAGRSRRDAAPSARTPPCIAASSSTSTRASSDTFARGARFQEDALTGDARTSGTSASLAGLEAALERGDELAVELALRRILLLYAIVFAYGGLPLIYMGDELGLRNDPGGVRPRAPRRQPLDAPTADGLGGDGAPPRRGLIEGRIWAGLRRLVDARSATRAVHARGTSRPPGPATTTCSGCAQVRRRPPAPAGELHARAPAGPHRRVHERGLRCSSPGPDGRPVRGEDDPLVLLPYQYAWLGG